MRKRSTPHQAQAYLHQGLLAHMSSHSPLPPGGKTRMRGAWESKAGRALSCVLCIASDESSRDIEWRDFEKARALARSLGLESRKDWVEWCMSRERPQDIPVDPALIYGGEGGPWRGWPDFLGYELQGRRSRWGGWRSFEEARGFVWTLGLKSKRKWREWSKSGERPDDIPSTPEEVYEEEGWLSWPDFLGYESVVWRSFEEARNYARGLGIKSKKEWKEWSKSGERPSDIPSNPDQVYKDKGWQSLGDFLGFDEGYDAGEWRSFEEARDYVRSLKLKSWKEWQEWSKSGERPPDIHSSPDREYKGKGWKSWPDFLGYQPQRDVKTHSTAKKRSFTEARDYARSLGLKSQKEWKEWSKSGERPLDIRSHPEEVYNDEGWLSWGDYLGYQIGRGAKARSATKKHSFTQARDYVRSIGLKSQKEWRERSKSGERPPDIPSDPDRVYKDKGWLSWGDFLGYDEGYDAGAEWRSYEDARDYVRSLELGSAREWWEWGKSGERPQDIPANPDRVYKGKGWKSLGNFLGYRFQFRGRPRAPKRRPGHN